MKSQLYRDIAVGLIIFLIISGVVIKVDVLSYIHTFDSEHIGESHSPASHILEIALVFFMTVSVIGIRYAFLFYSYMKTTEKVNFVMRRKDRLQSEQNKLSSLGELAGGLAHEINNALQPILGLSEIIQRRLQETDKQDLIENIDIVVERAKYARKIVQNMLTFARKQDVEKSPTPLDEAITESVGFASQYLPSTNEVDVSYKKKGLKEKTVLIDKTALIQVMLNLFINAAHAMKDKGTTLVEIDMHEVDRKEATLRNIKAGEYIKVDVIDMGTGIDKEIIDKIFNPFFTTKQNQGGTGLGLSTCYGIIQDMDGVIYADNHQLFGAIFTIYLPIFEEEDPS